MSLKLYILLNSVSALCALISISVLYRSNVKMTAKGTALLSIIGIVALTATAPVLLRIYTWFKADSGASLIILPGLGIFLLTVFVGFQYLNITKLTERVESLEKQVAILEQRSKNV